MVGGVVGLKDAEARLARIRLEAQGRLIVVYYFVEDVYGLLVLIRRTRTSVGTDFVYLCGDSWLGWLVGGLLRRSGRQVAKVRFSQRAFWLSDVKNLLRRGTALAMTADGRGPYGRIHPGLARLVAARNAVAVPLSVSAVTAFVDRSHRFALLGPWSRLAVAVGEPLEVGGRGDQEIVEALWVGLREAKRSAARLLG
jgi:hypothetical protein